MSTHQINRAVIYLATHPKSTKAILGYGYHLESVKNSLKNAKSPTRSTYYANKIINEFGGIDAWNWTIMSDAIYDTKLDLFKTFRHEYVQIYYNYDWERINKDRVCPVNHEVVDWYFKEAVW